METFRTSRYTYRVRAEGVPRDGLADAARRLFVGREAELGELGRGLDEALGGRGRLYLLSGEPGIGKTRLADELSELASARGVPVFWGRCWEAGGAPAFWPWLDVLASLADILDDAALAQGLGDGASLFAEPHLERCFVFHREGLLRAWERHDDMLALDPEARRMRAAIYSGSTLAERRLCLHARARRGRGQGAPLSRVPSDTGRSTPCCRVAAITRRRGRAREPVFRNP